MTINTGHFTVTNGAVGQTLGSLSNTGSLTIGPASTLTVNGNFTQSDFASITIGIGGAHRATNTDSSRSPEPRHLRAR